MDQKTYSRINELLDSSDLILKSNLKHKSVSDFDYDHDFKNETILITGAAGSVGSEITKQLVGTKFKSLILIDNAESSLYNLSEELEPTHQQNVEFILIDIRDEEAMNWLYETHKPTIVFHTAAYKHVPMMEDNAFEAVRLNILATKVLAELSVEHKIKKFIFISTDKAVKPVSVMGMTKRIAENYLNYLSVNYKTDFKSTRFGNILGSNGSVLPIFLKQINSGRPITITSNAMSRYFISKKKAGNLILKIATLNKNEGRLFTFNMGNPIKIIDLAKVLVERIKKSKNHKIELVGLRPGEKVNEDLIADGEKLELTKHSDLLKVHSPRNYNGKKVCFDILHSVKSEMKNSEIKQILEDSISKSQNSPTLPFAM